MKVVDRPYTPEAAVVKPQTAAEVNLLVYLSGLGKNKTAYRVRQTGANQHQSQQIHHWD